MPSDLLGRPVRPRHDPVGRPTVALAAVHAAPGNGIVAVLTADVDLARGSLAVRGVTSR
ncbi:hypothetical protein OHA98_17970 [Streptomyces sp. NBC_00654]|uniref:hypothetical protein n=1 Tax=Streptomyces sp. NBC_00654 TaxID=2975799 RepID=UPI00225C3839|nr:hypothetical protein [Streptomyces sp. NBC_00654]MCX4966694.1 hypothetical protein [Streptomyces sp. NBC_00654]